MRQRVVQSILSTLVLSCLWATPAFAKCGDQPNDLDKVATIRDRVSQQCDCATAFDRGTYLRCVRAVTTTAVGLGDLPPQCRSMVLRCAAKSKCGRPAAVVCRRTTASGRVKCGVKRSASRCKAPLGGSACQVDVESCCDVFGCNTTTTTTVPGTTTTTTNAPGTTTTSTTTTTTPGSTTTTTLGAPGDQLIVTTTPGTVSCGGAGLSPAAVAPFSGELDSDAACTTAITDLGLGCLYFGGGNATVVPPGKIPDGAQSYLTVTGSTLSPNDGIGPQTCTRAAGPGQHCVNNNAMPACTTDANCGGTAGSCALDANCFFGPPLPILSPPPFGSLTTCVINVVQDDAGGTVNTTTGDADVSLPLSTRVYITGNTGSPCPKCPGGTCTYGARSGLGCSAVGSQQTTQDCPPSLTGFQAPLGVDLTPLTTGTASLSNATGSFCPGQGNPGAFGVAAARCIQETGSPGGDLTDELPHPTVLGATFCIPATGNAAVDGVADLPGPGAIGLSGDAQLITAVTTTTTLTATTTTTASTAPPTTTTQPPLVCTDPTVQLPPFAELSIEILAGTTNCGGAALTPAPTAPFAGTLLNASATPIVSLGAGCLLIGGGGNTALPPSRVPDGPTVTFGVVGLEGLNVLLGPSPGTGPSDCTQGAGPGLHCIGGTNTGGTCTQDTDCGGLPGSCALDANCVFGPPLPLPVSAVPQLSSCIVNVLQQDMCGEIQLAAGGAAELNAGLASRVYLTGNLASPCPRCVSGTCNAGPNSGQACTAVGSAGTSVDCPPAPAQFIAPLSVVLSPLTTGTLEDTDPNGLFCPGQANAGAFGRTDARTIRTQGSPLNAVTLQLTAAGPFCVPATGNFAIDGVADVAGPGVVSVPSRSDTSSILELLGLPPLPSLPPLFP